MRKSSSPETAFACDRSCGISSANAIKFTPSGGHIDITWNEPTHQQRSSSTIQGKASNLPFCRMCSNGSVRLTVLQREDTAVSGWDSRSYAILSKPMEAPSGRKAKASDGARHLP